METDSRVRQKLSYEPWSMFTQRRAVRVAASRTAALAVWVRRNLRSGACRRRHRVSPAAGAAMCFGSIGPAGKPWRKASIRLVRPEDPNLAPSGLHDDSGKKRAQHL